jgi:hypothetical protein
VQVRAAVGQRDHLREGVGSLGAAQERGVPDLSAEAAGGTAAGAEGGGKEGHCVGCWWHCGSVCIVSWLIINGRPFNASSLDVHSGGELAEIGTSLAEDQREQMDPELNGGDAAQVESA